jgi:hypothetical protein
MESIIAENPCTTALCSDVLGDIGEYGAWREEVNGLPPEYKISDVLSIRVLLKMEIWT